MKNILILFVIALIAITIGFAVYAQNPRTQTTQTSAQPSDTIQIVTTNQILQNITKHIVGDTASVVSVAGLGVDAHDFEPTPKDIATIEKASVFVMNGAGLEPWAETKIADLKAKNITVVEMSDAVTLLSGKEEEHEDEAAHTNEEAAHEDGDEEHADEHEDENHADEEAHEDEHGHGLYDPHIWLSPRLMKQQVTALAAAISTADPDNALLYQENAKKLIAQLDAIDAEYTLGLAESSCKTRDVVVAHDAFSYLAADYNITMHPISGISSESEPSSARLAELTELVKEKQLQYVFFETLTSPKLAETIANEAGVKTLVLNPIEGFVNAEEESLGYLGLLRANLTNLKTGMVCQ